MNHFVSPFSSAAFASASVSDLRRKIRGASLGPHGPPSRLPFAASRLTSPATITAR